MHLSLRLANKKNRLIISIIIFFIIMFAMPGCDPFGGTYPPETAERWICDEPQFTLEAQQQANGVWVFSNQLFWDNDVLILDVTYRADMFVVYSKSYTNRPLPYEERLLSGTWRYFGPYLIFDIDEDFLFDGEYKTLVFHRG